MSNMNDNVDTMESWRITWRDGFATVLPTRGLQALRDALKNDDPRLSQGSTTTPPPLLSVADWPCEAACFIGFCGAMENGGFACTAEEERASKGARPYTNKDAATIGEVEQFFAKACFDCDQRMGKPAACRWWLNWWDDTPRDEAIRELLSEVERTLAERAESAPSTVESR